MCPICISIKEKNKLRERKLSNLNYYFPFKDKNNTSTSLQNSFRSCNNSFNKNNINNHIIYDNFINYENGKRDNILPIHFNNPFIYTKINNTLGKKRIIKDKLKRNNIKQVKSDKNIKMKQYEFLKEYLE